MKIFNYDKFRLSLNEPEILLVPEFKELFEKDKTKEKKKAFSRFTYIYLMLDWNSPFKEYSDEERKRESLISSDLTKEDIDESLEQALKKYDEIKNSNRILRYIKSTWTLLDKLNDYCNSVNLTSTIEEGPQKGKLIHSVRDVRDTIKQMEELILKAKNLRNIFKEEMEDDIQVRGDRQIGRDID